MEDRRRAMLGRGDIDGDPFGPLTWRCGILCRTADDGGGSGERRAPEVAALRNGLMFESAISSAILQQKMRLKESLARIAWQESAGNASDC